MLYVYLSSVTLPRDPVQVRGRGKISFMGLIALNLQYSMVPDDLLSSANSPPPIYLLCYSLSLLALFPIHFNVLGIIVFPDPFPCNGD